MSLNKLTNSSDYLEKQYLNIGCNDIKCSSLEVKGEPVGTSFEYNPVIVPVTPADANFQAVTALYNTVGDHMNIDCLFFSVVLPTNTNELIFKIPMPTGYIGYGGGLGFVSLVANATDANGNTFNPNISQFELDNQSIRVNMLSSNQVQGIFAISIHITCKVVKQ
jgi:hypothetical protein